MVTQPAQDRVMPMQVASTIKKAPKWAWYTVGGVAIGGVGLRLWKSRATSTDAAASDGSAAADPTNYGYGTGGVSGVIVPPVILPQNDTAGDATGLLGAILGGVSDLTGLVLGSVEDIIGPTQESQQGLIDVVGQGILTGLTANAGPPPQQVQNNAPVVQTPVTPPVITGQVDQPSTISCPSDYPYPGTNPGSCYKVVCLTKGDGKGHGAGRWHVYRDGSWHQVTSGSC